MSAAATIALAIAISAPWMKAPQRQTYAAAIVHASGRAHVPPLLFVAIIENESHWHTGATNGSYIGLGQVGLDTFPACRRDRSAQACAAVRSMLLSGTGNIAAMGTVLRANRKYCGKKMVRFLAGYQTGKCVPVPLTHRVMARYRAIARAVRRAHPRPRPRPRPHSPRYRPKR